MSVDPKWPQSVIFSNEKTYYFLITRTISIFNPRKFLACFAHRDQKQSIRDSYHVYQECDAYHHCCWM